MYQYELNANDLALVQTLASTHCRAQVKKGTKLIILHLSLIIVGSLFMAGVISLFKKYAGTSVGSDMAWVAGLALGFLVLMIVYIKAYQKRFAAWKESELGPFPIQQELRIEPTGLVVESKFGQVLYPWKAIHTLQALENHFMFTTAAASVVVIPFRAFPTADERNKFETDVRANIYQP